MTVDLRTRYLGLDLKHPIVASASPLTSSVDSLKRLQDAGVAAVVLPSLFEEQIEHEEMATHNLMLYGAELSPEAQGFFPEMQYSTGPEKYLQLITEAKKSLSVPVIASLNGYTPGGWTGIAHQFQEAGADALELNVYFLAASIDDTSAEVENRYVELVESVTRQVSIPVAVKVAPYFSAMANMAAGSRRPVHRDLSCSTASCSPTSCWRNWKWRLTWCCPPPRNCAWRCAGSRSCAGASMRASRPRAVRTPPRTCSSFCWRARTA